MHNTIIIIPNINENFNAASTIIEIQDIIVSYFGKKFSAKIADFPYVTVTTEITQEDLNNIVTEIDRNWIDLRVILSNNYDNERLMGQFIDLRE